MVMQCHVQVESDSFLFFDMPSCLALEVQVSAYYLWKSHTRLTSWYAYWPGRMTHQNPDPGLEIRVRVGTLAGSIV